MYAEIGITEIVERFGAFGILSLLIGAFVWKGLPWIASRIKDYELRIEALQERAEKRFNEMQLKHEQEVQIKNERHDKQIELIMKTHEAVSEKLVASLDSLSIQIANMNTRISAIESQS
jgi:F0F1-type ATP synthase membrane subunit b/b'